MLERHTFSSIKTVYYGPLKQSSGSEMMWFAAYRWLSENLIVVSAIRTIWRSSARRMVRRRATVVLRGVRGRG
jgi:hypothetical protein